jgi:SAM-dependent methyltransferase
VTDAAVDAPEERSLDLQNAEFWDTLCGTHLATSLGITDRSAASLKKFDDWFLEFYPYLTRRIALSTMRGKRVLEVGLGYGTIAQQIAEAGADYRGLDIASGPVEMANHRLRLNGLGGEARVGSILAAPFDDGSFDAIVAIGCYHHTGDLQRAFDESYRLLCPGGILVFMVYNAYSYRRWATAPAATLRYFAADWLRSGSRAPISARERAAYDTNPAGEAAPHTDFVSRHALRWMCRRFASFTATLENIDQEKPFATRPRAELMKTLWPRICGLDIYAHARR